MEAFEHWKTGFQLIWVIGRITSLSQMAILIFHGAVKSDSFDPFTIHQKSDNIFDCCVIFLAVYFVRYVHRIPVDVLA